MTKSLLLFFNLMMVSMLGFSTVHSVTIQNSVFHPSPLTINVGDTVVWTNNTINLVSVRSSLVPTGASTFDSGTMTNSSTFQVIFKVPGNYFYQNGLNPSMFGQVTVDEVVGLDEFAIDEISSFPNPATDKVVINGLTTDNVNYKVYSSFGNDYLLSGTGNEVDVSKLENGAYFIFLETDEQHLKTLKFLKE